MKTVLTAAVIGLTATSAMAQSNYYDRNRAYQNNTQIYQQDRRAYDQQVRDYEAARAQYERDQRAYDRRYGAGAYARYYGPFAYERPVWSDRVAQADPYRYYASSPCERATTQSRERTSAGAAIGALAGAAIGAGVNDGNDTGAAILGAVVGGVLGANIARNSGEQARLAAKCDASGYYYSYDQTMPYRESDYDRRGRSGRYDGRYYVSQRCRLAVAPTDFNGTAEYRYVRVCPDRQGRYRITS